MDGARTVRDIVQDDRLFGIADDDLILPESNFLLEQALLTTIAYDETTGGTIAAIHTNGIALIDASTDELLVVIPSAVWYGALAAMTAVQYGFEHRYERLTAAQQHALRLALVCAFAPAGERTT